MIRTPDQRLRVFISSTLQELAPERRAAQDAVAALHLLPVMFELGARPHPPADLYRAYLRQSHVFVGLYWQRYGWVAPDMEISGLEDEWVLADRHAKLVYIKEPAPDREARLSELIGRIREDNSTSYRTFRTTDELRDLLENDLAILLSERFETDLAAAANAERTAPALTHAVPNPPSPIIGRDIELRELTEMLHRDDTRLVTITGSGGSGKTRLAVELAGRLRDAGECTVAFADLTGLRSSSLVMPTIAAALGVRDPGERTLVEAMATVVAGEDVLLVVDNFEHVIDTAGELAELLAATERVKVLVTSRQPLRLRWEQEFPLHPLPVPDPVQQTSVDAVGASPAVELLVERVHRVRPTFALTDDNVAAVAEIARRLDGLPLALELAAARLRVLQPGDLLARLGHRLDALGASTPDLPARHRTLRATIAWSHEHLSEPEQRVFRRLGVFAGGAGIDAVESVCSGDGVEDVEVLELVESLVDKSLVVSSGDAYGAEEGSTRFAVLETIREYAVEQLVAAGEAEVTWDRHLEWHADLALRAWTRFWTADMPAWLGVLEREHDNVRSALDHAAGAGDVLLGLRAAASMWPYWDVRGQYREGERRLRELLERAPEGPSVERGRALNARGWLVALMGDFEAALGLMSEGVPLVRSLGTEAELAWSLAEKGNVTFSLGMGPETVELFTESMAIADRLDDPFLTGLGWFGLAYAALLDGDLDAMSERIDKSLAMTRRMYQPWGIAWAQFSKGVLHVLLGENDQAVAPVTESLELRWSIHDARGLPESIQMLATLASAAGENDWSALLHGAAERQREANGLTILPFLRPLHDESVQRLHEAYDDDTLRDLWQLGRSMPLEKLVPEALARTPALDVRPRLDLTEPTTAPDGTRTT